MEFLELPEEMRALIAPDAPREVEARRFKAEIAGETREFLVAPWLDKEKGCWRAFAVGAWCKSPYMASFQAAFADSSHVFRADWPVLMQRALLVRRIPFRPDQRLVLFPEQAQITGRNGAISCDLSFLGYANGFFELSDAQLVDALNHCIAQTDDPFHVVYQWFCWTPEERLREFCALKQGEFGQLRQIHENLGVLLSHLSPELVREEWSWNWVETPHPFDEDFHFAAMLSPEEEVRHEALGQYLRLWRAAMKRFFGAKYLWNSEVSREVRGFFPNEDNLFSIEFESIPTAHELLEAQVFLSDWAQQNVPDLAEKLQDFPRS